MYVCMYDACMYVLHACMYCMFVCMYYTGDFDGEAKFDRPKQTTDHDNIKNNDKFSTLRLCNSTNVDNRNRDPILSDN